MIWFSSSFIWTFAGLAGFFIIESAYKKVHYSYLRYYQLFLVFAIIIVTLQGMNVIMEDFPLYPIIQFGVSPPTGLLHFIANFFYYPWIYAVLYFSEITSRDSMDSKKLVAITVFMAFLFLSNFISADLGAVLSIGGLLIFSVLILKVAISTVIKSPPFLKKKASLYLITWISYLAIWIGFNIAGTVMADFLGGSSVFSYIYMVLLSALILILSLLLKSEPRLGFVLPFKALRLLVIDTESGIPLFTHTWKAGEKLANDDLFSSMLQGITLIMKEAVDEGDVEEISLKNAKIIFKKKEQHDVGFAIVCSKSSKTLRNGLDSFSNDFVKEHGNALSSTHDVSQFDSATNLVDKCFSFIPVQD